MSIQVTHMKGLPRNINYWDYHILCRCTKHAGNVLQRMEFWDGTKAGGNIHAEQINDQLKEAGKKPTQDTSRFVYKSREELAWEMLDTCKERVTYDLLDYLSNTLHFLNTRRNPYKAFDRTLQYEFQSVLVQDRLNQLNAIIKHFIALGRQMRPVLFAIEQLTLEGYYIHRVEKDGVLDGKGDLTIEEVTKKLRAMHEQVEKDNEECKQPIIKGEKRYKPALPYFIRADMGRDEQLGFSKDSDLPLCKSAQSSVQENTMDCADLHDGLCKSAQAIPVITYSNNNSGNDTVRESTNALSSIDETRTLTNSPSSLQALPEQLTEEQRETTAPLSEENGTTEPALPEIEAEAQGEQVPPTKQAESPIASGDTGQDAPSEQEKPKTTRKRRAKRDVPEELRERVDTFYAFLDEWRQGITGESDESFERTAAGDEAICKLLQKKKPPTHNRFKKMLDEMWNEPKNERTGYWTRKRMGSVAFICGEYETRCLAVGSTEQVPVTNTKQIVENVASIAGYTQKTVDLALSQQEAPAMRHLGPRRNRKGA